MNKCAFCNIRIDNRNRRSAKKDYKEYNRKKHTNIHNNPQVSYFCSFECKIQWIYQISRKEAPENFWSLLYSNYKKGSKELDVYIKLQERKCKINV